MKKPKLTALCGMMTALSVVLMFFTTFLPVLMYVLPIVTGIIVLLIKEVSNRKWASAVYFATAILSLLLITDKEAALTYALFFGYYPIIRDFVQKLPKLLAWTIKIFLFNVAAVLVGVTGVYIFGLSAEEYSEFGKATVPILLSLANVVFLMYDVIFNKYDFLFKYAADKLKRTMK